MLEDEKKQPEPNEEEPKAEEKDKPKSKDLIVDITGQKPPGWGTTF